MLQQLYVHISTHSYPYNISRRVHIVCLLAYQQLSYSRSATVTPVRVNKVNARTNSPAPAPVRGYIKPHFTPLSHYYLQLPTAHDNYTPRRMAMSLLFNTLLLATLAAIITVSSTHEQGQTVNTSFKSAPLTLVSTSIITLPLHIHSDCQTPLRRGCPGPLTTLNPAHRWRCSEEGMEGTGETEGTGQRERRETCLLLDRKGRWDHQDLRGAKECQENRGQ